MNNDCGAQFRNLLDNDSSTSGSTAQDSSSDTTIMLDIGFDRVGGDDDDASAGWLCAYTMQVLLLLGVDHWTA